MSLAEALDEHAGVRGLEDGGELGVPAFADRGDADDGSAFGVDGLAERVVQTIPGDTVDDHKLTLMSGGPGGAGDTSRLAPPGDGWTTGRGCRRRSR